MAIFIDGWSIVPQFRKCGKAICKTCEEGKGHGPYYYGTKVMNGKKKSKYFGSQLPSSSDTDDVNPLANIQEGTEELGAGYPSFKNFAHFSGDIQKTMVQKNEEEMYKEIKQAIIQQKLRPNMQLVEDVIAEAFGVSRTPVRNVLRQLAREKLVTIIPHKGTFVSCPTVKEVKEVFEMRRALESTAIRHACNRMTDEQFRQLKRMIAEEHHARAKRDLFAALQLSCDFHLKIAEMTDNSYYCRYLEELVSLNYVIFALYGHKQLVFCDCQMHAQILHAMEQRDDHLAANLMSEHLTQLEMSLEFNETNAPSASLTEIFKRGHKPAH